MRIDILHVADCPNAVLLRARLQNALEQLGIAPEVQEVEVTTSDHAELVGMNGSPTILIDGRDPFPASPPSLACRLYRNAGAVGGAPSVEALVEVLA